jgi:hypothetical protein
LKDGKFKKSFLGTAVLKDTRGEGSVVQDELNSLEFYWKDNQGLVGLGTDGAPNMTGNITGLTTRMRNVKHFYSYALY